MPSWHVVSHHDTNKQGTRCNTTRADLTKTQLYVIPSACGKNVLIKENSYREKQVHPSQVCTITQDNTPSLTYDFIRKKLVQQWDFFSNRQMCSLLYCSFRSKFGVSCRTSMNPFFARKVEPLPYHLSNKVPLVESPVLRWEKATSSWFRLLDCKQVKQIDYISRWNLGI